MAPSALQVPVLAGCCNVFTNCDLLAFPLQSLVVPRRRTNPKCSILLVSRIVPSRTEKLQKQCIVRAITPNEATASNTPLTDVQEATQKGRKKGSCFLKVMFILLVRIVGVEPSSSSFLFFSVRGLWVFFLCCSHVVEGLWDARMNGYLPLLALP